MGKLRGPYVLMAVVLGMIVGAAPGAARAQTVHSNYNLLGTYRISFIVFSAASGKLESGVGILVADGLGRITGTEVFNTGTTVCNVTVSGTYFINPNGTGTLSASFTSPAPGCTGTFNSSLLLYNGGSLVKSISTDPLFVTVSEEWVRQVD